MHLYSFLRHLDQLKLLSFETCPFFFSAVSCGDPGFMNFGIRQGKKFLFEYEVTYTCLKGYQPNDHVGYALSTPRTITVTCEDDRKWTKGPYCKGDCLKSYLTLLLNSFIAPSVYEKHGKYGPTWGSRKRLFPT